MYKNGAAIEKDDFVYFVRKKCDIVEYGQTTEGEAGAMGFHVAGATGHNMRMANRIVDSVMKYEVGNDQMTFGVFLKNEANLIFLKKKLISKRKMLVVLLAKWRNGAEPAEPAPEETLVETATPTMVDGFLRRHLWSNCYIIVM